MGQNGSEGETVRRLLTLAFCLAIGFPADALRYYERGTDPQQTGATIGDKLMADSFLQERADRVGRNGLTPVAEWLIANTDIENDMSPHEIVAFGRQSLDELFNASDRINPMWVKESRTGVIGQVEST